MKRNNRFPSLTINQRVSTARRWIGKERDNFFFAEAFERLSARTHDYSIYIWIDVSLLYNSLSNRAPFSLSLSLSLSLWVNNNVEC